MTWFALSCAVVGCSEDVVPSTTSPGGASESDKDTDQTGSKSDEADDGKGDEDTDTDTGSMDAGGKPGGGKSDAAAGDASRPGEGGRGDAAIKGDAGGVTSPSDAGGGIDAGVVADAGTPPDASPPIDAGPAPDAGPSGPTLPPLPTDGEPLTAPERTWTYIEFPDTKCRDGSPAGISVSLSKTSKKVLMYLEGGGACFDANTCNLASSANVDGTNLTLSDPGTGANINSAKKALTEGIFDRSNGENPIRDWNIVYVPYCTGDTHAGTRESPVDVPGALAPRNQWFVGQLNIRKFLNRIVPTFPDAEDVLLAGVSAGGYGTLSNLYLVQRAFPNVKVKHVNDSGAPLSKAASPECLQQKFRDLWRIDLSVCGDACPNPNDYTQDNALFLAKFFADRPAGFLDTTEDGTISLFLGTGNNNCTGTFGVSQVPAATYRREILAYADKLKAYPNYGAFTPAGTKHTYLRTSDFYTVRAGGVRLVDWFTKIVNGQAPGQARD